jgi:hypothetical protein
MNDRNKKWWLWKLCWVVSTANRSLYSNILVNVYITHRSSHATHIENVRTKPQPETMSSHPMGDYDSYMVGALSCIVN